LQRERVRARACVNDVGNGRPTREAQGRESNKRPESVIKNDRHGRGTPEMQC